MRLRLVLTQLLLVLCLPAAGEEKMFAAVMVERLEHQIDADATLLDLQATYGGDEQEVVIKLEGEIRDDGHSEYELDIMHGHPFSAFFDFQIGAEIADEGDGSVLGLVAGFEGLAPYRIELDTTAVITTDGDVRWHLELERDFLLSPTLALQPRVELGAALSDIDGLGIAAGFHNIELEIRTRYEVTRKFAPYLGISWQRRLGNTADLVVARGESSLVRTIVAGVSFWF